MDKQKRKELLEEYKQIKTYMGVFQIKNKTNGKIYIGSCPNLKNKWLTLESQLAMGRFANLQLQKDWKELGLEAFTYEVLEEKEADEIADKRWELKQMEKKWLEKLQPFGDKGYNKPPKE
ncbi:GIY-YIG nuclease family protein [Paenibacillus sp. DMB20]|uniref:GIY-YIG nuclease family protein n=1 Tax=Paenibacillus sp. DMB20 TaxID=1642570 RepID=UPI000627E07A|nr:GIY-YIG nuclease family protein [Paenibacillus sp. DMB20]KKO50766.1 LuxR family transcriptional regulator [Paenibacillus sp. DMB20]